MGRQTDFSAAGGDAPARILLLLSSLHGGGAERVAVHLLNSLDRSRFDVRMGLLRKSGPWLEGADQERIVAAPNGERRFVYEGTNSGFYRPGRLIAGASLAPLAFRRMIKDFRPDVVMSFLKGTSLITFAALAGLGARRPRWIIREGNNTLAVINEEVSNPVARAIVTRVTIRAYRAADCVLANARDMAEGIGTDLGLDPARLRVINNPIDLDRVRRLAIEPIPNPPPRPFIVTVGRLEYQKGHDLLLRAFAAGAARAGHDLLILGRGTREAELRALAAKLGIAGQVRFEGFCENPWAYVSKARLFVLPSRWEGFPTAAAEALACGTPALLADCRFGPRDVLEHGLSGWIVAPENVEALGDAIDRIVGDEGLRAALVENGLIRARTFAMGAMLDRYGDLFAEQARAGRARGAGEVPSGGIGPAAEAR